jgi:hypothetical protein
MEVLHVLNGSAERPSGDSFVDVLLAKAKVSPENN